MEQKLMHIYYGYGKGKTTTAVGMACRASNRGLKVLFTAFLKSKDSGEFLSKSSFDIDEFDFCNKFWNEMSIDEKNQANTEIKSRLAMLIDKAEIYDMIILDEFLDVVSFGCIDRPFAVKFLKEIYGKCELVITGHRVIGEIFEIADYITEMKKEKHPYDKGVGARYGIEY